MAIEPTWPAVGLAVVANVTTWIVLARKNSNTKNTNPENSNSRLPCGVHGEKIAKLEKTDELKEKWLEEFKKNNTLEHKQLSDKLDQLNNGK